MVNTDIGVIVPVKVVRNGVYLGLCFGQKPSGCDTVHNKECKGCVHWVGDRRIGERKGVECRTK